MLGLIAVWLRKTCTESWPVWTQHGPRPKPDQPFLMFEALSETGKTLEKTSCVRPASTHALRVFASIASPVCRSEKGDAASTSCSMLHLFMKYSVRPSRDTPPEDQISPAIAGLMPSARSAVFSVGPFWDGSVPP